MEEFFDELDENGEFTGRIISRTAAHKNGLWHRTISLSILNKKGQILLQKRSLMKNQWPGVWDTASGGHVSAGELGLESAIRETEEEIGLKLDKSEIRFISSCRSVEKSDSIFDSQINEYFVVFKDIDIFNLKLQKEEVDEVKWFEFDDFKKLVEEKSNSLFPKWDAYEAVIKYIEIYGIE